MEPLVFLIANKMMIIIWPAAITEIGIHGAPRTCWLVGFIFLVHVRYRSIGTLRYERFIWSWSDSNFGHFCWSVNPCVKIWLFIIENHFSRDKSHISENHHKHNNLNCVLYRWSHIRVTHLLTARAPKNIFLLKLLISLNSLIWNVHYWRN